MINELLRKRILGLTGDAATLPPESMEAENQQAIDSLSELTLGKGAISNKEMEIFRSTAPQGPRLIDGSPLPEGMVPGLTRTMEYRDYNQNGIEDRDEGIYLPRDLVPESSLPPRMNYPDAFFATPPEGGFQSNMPTMPRIPTDKDPLDEIDEETRQKLQDLLGKAGQKAQAPLAGLAEQLAMAGEGEDTALAHLRPGEIVIPPEFMDDASFESALEKKFEQFNINPEEAVVGVGIASLNPQTGLEQFGFFKKIGKSLKKVVKKVAPIAAFIPGVGTALGGVLGGIGSFATKIPGIGGALGKIGSTVAGGIANLGIPGISSIAGGTSGGFAGIKDALTTQSGLLGGGMFGQTGSTYLGGPSAGKGLANRLGLGSGTPAQVQAYEAAQKAQQALNAMTPAQMAANPQQVAQLQQIAAGGASTGLTSNVASILGGGAGAGTGTGTGGGGGGGFLSGLGNFAKTAGIGALAAGLGKLAYEDAQKQTGVPLTPLTTLSPTGRYNIEAEIARRMGQEAPNPVEFGLLPAGTIPELSGGKPAGMQEGGPVALDSLAPAPISRTPDMMMFSIDVEIKNLMTEYDMVVRNKEFERAQMIADEIDQLQQQKIAIQSQNMPQQESGPLEMGEQTTAQMIEEAMEIVRLAEQEPRIKDMPEYQAALNLLGVGGIGSINPTPLVPGAKLGFEQGKLANTRLGMRMGRALGALGNKLESTAEFGPNLPMSKMYGGPVMAYAQGGAVALQEGGELDPSQFPRMDGDINGPGTETSDDIPAMLSDGEFVMTGQAVRGAGSYDMQKDNKGIISLIPSFNEDRERGMDLMYKMMDTFAGEAKPS